MKWRIQFYGLMVLLLVAGFGLAAYKVFALRMPFWPGAADLQWVVEARVAFFVDPARPESQVIASLALPDPPAREGDFRESAASLQYGFTIRDDGSGRRAVWTASGRQGPQTLYYRVAFREPEKSRERFPQVQPPPPPRPPIFDEGEDIAAREIVAEARSRSADVRSFAIEVLRRIPPDSRTPEVALLYRVYRRDRSPDEARAALAEDLFRAAGIPARRAQGVWLDESRGAQEPVPLIEVYDGSAWQVINPAEPEKPLPRQLFVWNRGGRSLIDVERAGENSRVTFTAVRELVDSRDGGTLAGAPVWAAILQSLPVSERAVFRFIIMVPIGALVVVLLRNLAGVPTLGTFMPVLIALSFSQMDSLPAALALFALVISVGLYFRFLLSRLNLLVVPRVAACVVIVTLLMVATSVASYHLGLDAGLGITLFPMIILAWTIERMSLLWDEEGAAAALGQVGGSLMVAVAAYLVMGLAVVRHWCYYFPELLLVVLAAIILLGRYTGYRLSELHRFRHFRPPA
jgi:hypothetical protein